MLSILTGAGKIIGRFAKGVIFPLGIKGNLGSPEGGVGKFDYIRLAGSIAFLFAVVMFLLGNITLADLEALGQFISEFVNS